MCIAQVLRWRGNSQYKIFDNKRINLYKFTVKDWKCNINAVKCVFHSFKKYEYLSLLLGLCALYVLSDFCDEPPILAFVTESHARVFSSTFRCTYCTVFILSIGWTCMVRTVRVFFSIYSRIYTHNFGVVARSHFIRNQIGIRFHFILAY